MIEAPETTKELVDTNIFVYAADPSAPEKRARATALIEQLADRDALAISVQVLNEFYVSATRPNKPPSLTHEEAAQIVRDLANSSEVFPLSAMVTFRALEAMPSYSLSFWDALIWAVAKENGAAVVHSEDFQHGRTIEGVRFQNPFVDPGS